MSIPDAPSAQDGEKNASLTHAKASTTELETLADAPGESMELDSAPTEILESSDIPLNTRGAGESNDAMGNADEATPAVPAATAAETSAKDTAQGRTIVDEAQPANEVNEGAVAPPPAKPLCGVCGENIGKYKCARCQLPFCSVVCSKTHRENHPPDPDPPIKPAATLPAFEGRSGPDSALSNHSGPFSALDDSDQLRYLFRRYPHLPQQLLAIGAEADPPPEAQPGTLKEAILAKAAAASKPKKDQWNQDVGIRKGKEALRKARKAEGDDGEGLREYTELIAHLTSQGDKNKVAEMEMHDRYGQQDADLLRRILQGENGR